MGRPDPIRYDNFARSLATGVSNRAAARAAGYGTKSSFYSKIAKRPEFLELVARYRRELRDAGSADLAPMIVQLIETAEQAMDNGLAEHIAVAAWVLSQAARPKPKLGPRRISRGRLGRARFVATAFFDRWSEHNILQPFDLPSDWTRLRALDWGSRAPFSVGWWAVASEDTHTGDGLVPSGALIRYREWYGQGPGGQGLRLDAEAVAAGILDRERAAGDDVGIGVADPSIFVRNGGPSIAERMADAGVAFRRANNTRVGKAGAGWGWDQVRARIRGDGERPMLYVFDTCADFIRTVPALPHDPDEPRDVDTKAEDHIADETRYACLSRPLLAGPAEGSLITPLPAGEGGARPPQRVARRRMGG